MTREELREYVEELESQGEIPYHVYSNLIDCIDTLEQESILDKVKQAREKIENEVKFWSDPSTYNVESMAYVRKAKARSYKHCLEILDKLIESEG